MNQVAKESIIEKSKISDRLKIARSLAGFSERKAFANHFGISNATLEAWERGVNPLTLKGARKIVEALRSVGMYCSEEWLQEGKGLSPRPLKELAEPYWDQSPNSFDKVEASLSIAREIALFTTSNEDALVTFVKDDAMLPFYQEGDYVGGIKLKGSSIHKALDKRCIIELPSKKLTVRQLQKSQDQDKYTLSAINPATKTTPTVLYDVDILSASPIVWHRSLSL